MIGRVVDITKWGAEKRSVLYRLTQDQTEFALVIGTQIGRDGTAELVIFGKARMMPWQVLAKFGEGVGEFTFVEPLPEIQDLLDILTGKSKPGAPLPDEVEKGFQESVTDVVDPLDDKSARHTRQTAVKNSRL